MKKKLVYVVSDIDKSLHFEWVSLYLNANFEVFFILIGLPDSALERFLKSHGIAVESISYSHKIELLRVWFKVFLILFKLQPEIVHTHLWIGNVIGLTAAWLTRVKKRVYTRHHATIHYKEYPSGLKWDKLNNALATEIVAISKNIQRLLIDSDCAEEKKIKLIPHGFSFSYFQNVEPQRVSVLYDKYKLTVVNRPVIGVISRFTEWKGIQFIIPAFARLRHTFPEAHLILANAHGDYEKKLDSLLCALPSFSYTKIRFESDLAALYRLFDVFVHTPVDAECEAFGQTYIEPLIVGIPCIFTMSGIAPEVIVHGKNALVVDFQNTEQIYDSMLRILNDPTLRGSLSETGKKSVQSFTIDNYLSRLKDLYLE